MKLLLKSPLHGLIDDHLILLRWRGRKTGNDYGTPVGYEQEGSELTIFSFSSWHTNCQHPHPVKVKLRGEWRSGMGVLEKDPRTCAAFVRASIGDGELGGYRRFRMDVEGDRHPTIEELIPEVEERDMALLLIELADRAS